MKTIRLTAAQAMVRYLSHQINEDGVPFLAGCWAIFGHGNVAGIGEALHAAGDAFPTWRAHNEQGMAHAAIAFSKALNRKRAMAVTTSIGPGALNMVTAAALAHVNRLPVLFIPGDVFANRAPDPVLQQVESFGDGTVSANDAFRPVSRYYDRIARPEHLLTALPRAFATMTDPADCGPVTLAFCQDVQAEAYDWPMEFFAPKEWHRRRPRPGLRELKVATDALRGAKQPIIIAGGGVHYAEATATLRTFAERHNVPVGETQAGKSALPHDHPLNLGSVGVTGSSAANAVAEAADVVIALGTRLQDFTTGSWALFKDPDRRIVAINVTPYDAHKHNALPLIADAAAGARGNIGTPRRPAFPRHRQPQGGVDGSSRRGDRGPRRRQRAANRHAGDRRGATLARRRRDRGLRLRRAAGRAAQALAGRHSRMATTWNMASRPWATRSPAGSG